MLKKSLLYFKESSAAQKSALALAFKLLGAGGNYFLLLYIARNYGAENLGYYTLSFTLIQLCALLALQGLELYLIRFSPVEEKKGAGQSLPLYFQCLIATVTGAIIIQTLLFFILPLLNGIFSHPLPSDVSTILILTVLPYAIVGLNSSAFRSRKNMTGYFIFGSCLGLTTLLIYFLFFKSFSLYPLLITCIVAAVISLFSWITYSGFSTADIKLKKKSLSLTTAWPMLVTGLMFYIMGYADNLFLAVYTSPASIGIYDVAYKLATSLSLILHSVNSIQGPMIAELHAHGDIQSIQRKLDQANRMTFFASIPLVLFLVIFAGPLLGLFGTDFRGAYTPFMILLCANILNCFCGSVGVVMQMTGQQKLYNGVVVFSALTGLLLLYILVPVFSITGAAIAAGTMVVFQNLIALYLLYRKTGILSLYRFWR